MTYPRPIPADVRAKTLLLAKTDPTGARAYVRSALQLGKSQGNDTYLRILKEGVAPAETREVAVTDTDLDSLEAVVKHAKVDTSQWDVVDYSITKAHKTVKQDGTSVPVPRFDFRLKLKRKTVSPETLLGQFATEANKHSPKTFKYDRPGKERDCVYVLNLHDIHIGKLAWGKQTGGADYDLPISKAVFKSAVEELMTEAPRHRIEEVIVIAGSDFFQVDTDNSTTTAGTYVDSDGRLSKIFAEGCKLMTEMIEKLAETCRVRVMVVPGNHDALTSLFLGHYLTAWFRLHANVVIDNEPKSRKYVGYGTTLIGFDHGDKTKLADLPLILMRENQRKISQYTHMTVLSGHIHVETVKDIKGIIVRTAPALCPPDAWHAQMGYVGNVRTSQGLLYQREQGLKAIYYSTPLE